MPHASYDEDYELAKMAALRSPLDLAVLMYPETKRWPQVVLLNNYLVALVEYRLTAQGPVPAEDVSWWFDKDGDRHVVLRPNDIPWDADDWGADTPLGPVVFRLQVSMMPRAGKSRIITESFIPWLQLKFPGIQTGLATYNDDFAKTNWGGPIRDKLIEQNRIWDFLPRPASNREPANEVRLNTGGRMRFVGQGGSITGKTLNVLVSDDLIKNDDVAQSPAERQSAKNFYDNSWITRKTEEATGALPIPVEVAMGTRWHVDDVLNHAVSTAPEEWCTLVVPALSVNQNTDPLDRPPGTPHPNARGHRKASLLKLQKQDPYNFACLYQGDPILDTGNALPQRTDVNLYEELGGGMYRLPSGATVYEDDCVRISGADLAATKKTSADFTVILNALYHPPTDTILVMRHAYYDRLTTDEYHPVLTEHLQSFGPKLTVTENITYGAVFGRTMENEGVRVEFNPHGMKDKLARANISKLPVRLRRGTVLFPQPDARLGDPDWLRAYDVEAPPFPNGAHDDVVDTLVHICWWVDDREPKHKQPEPDEEKRRQQLGESQHEYMARRFMEDVAKAEREGRPTKRGPRARSRQRFAGVSRRRRR